MSTYLGAPFGSFNLELRPLMTEAIFSLIVRKIRCFWKIKAQSRVLYLKIKHILEEIYLLKRSSIDRNIFQKSYIEICLRYMRHLLDIAA